MDIKNIAKDPNRESSIEWASNGLRLKEIVIDLLDQKETGSSLAIKHKVTTSYISQIKRKLRQLQIKPNLIDNKLLCAKCQEDELLEFHHDHETGIPIALICHSCNIKLGKNKWEFGFNRFAINKNDQLPSFETNEYKLTKILKMIDDGFLVVDPKKLKNREDDIKWLESLS